MDKNLFIVTSCIKPITSSISAEDRYKQTLETFDSVRKMVPDALIYFADGSHHELTEKEIEELSSKVDLFLNFSKDENTQAFNKYALKSHGECYMLLHTIKSLKELPIFPDIKRVFKLGGRCKLTDKFDIKDYDNTEGKYVFKKRLDSWMDKSIQESYGSPHILETRLYSLCSTLIDDYIGVLLKNFDSFKLGLDTEHSHFININPDNLIEFDYVNCECIVAGIHNSLMID
jgi:hypothetical protein